MDEPPEEIFSLVSRVKYPQAPPRSRQREELSDGTTREIPEESPKDIELTVNRRDLTDSLRALAEKYSLTELTLATDDGLVFATSTDRDVQPDAVKYSQIFRHQAPPDDPHVSLFELMHRESRLIGIIRTSKEIPQNRKRGIRDDTKVILQWWL